MTLERIEITPFTTIVGEIVQNRQNGHLTIVRQSVRRVLYWSQGELVLITSSAAEESLGHFLVQRGILTLEQVAAVLAAGPTDAVASFNEAGFLDRSRRQTVLREWAAFVFLPLFSLDEGTAAFTIETAIDPEKRVFLQSTAALVLEGVRSISNGMVLRRSLGDLKRDIALASNSRLDIEAIPLTDAEHRIAAGLSARESIESFLKRFSSESATAAKVVIGLLTLGVFATVDATRPREEHGTFDDMQRDLELLAAIGPDDPKSLRAVSLSRQLGTMDYYAFLEVTRAATRTQIITSAEAMRKKYDPQTFPAVVRAALLEINRRIDEAQNILQEPVRRAAYDQLLSESGARGAGASIQQRVAQRAIVENNLKRARELSTKSDFYGAIVLLKQAAQFAPDRAQVWSLLAACQEQNPKWHREAAESYQKALSLEPDNVDTMISLGDLYRNEGFVNRAQSCYEDVLKTAPDNQEAKNRITALRQKK